MNYQSGDLAELKSSDCDVTLIILFKYHFIMEEKIQ